MPGATRQPQENTHDTIESAVRDFSVHMKHKMLLSRHRHHWSVNTPEWLLSRARDELAELEEAIESGDRKAIVSEAADVAIFMMFIADNEQWGDNPASK